jgi:hypothetical protein
MCYGLAYRRLLVDPILAKIKAMPRASLRKTLLLGRPLNSEGSEQNHKDLFGEYTNNPCKCGIRRVARDPWHTSYGEEFQRCI